MSWQEELKNNVTTIEELAKYIPFESSEIEKLESIVKDFPMSIPRYYLSLIDPNDPNDPIRKMSLPALEELDDAGMWDTSGEASNTKTEGLQHKYAQTTLILSTSKCAMYCRHCFRKRLVGTSDEEVAKTFAPILSYIKEHQEINNVLISGGDSFLNNNQVIAYYLKELSGIEHLDFIRFGTRIPVSLPSRITEDPELIDILREYGKKKTIYVTTQFNHTNELTPQAIASVDLLLSAGVIVNNQTVLLPRRKRRSGHTGKPLQFPDPQPYHPLLHLPVQAGHSCENAVSGAACGRRKNRGSGQGEVQWLQQACALCNVARNRQN